MRKFLLYGAVLTCRKNSKLSSLPNAVDIPSGPKNVRTLSVLFIQNHARIAQKRSKKLYKVSSKSLNFHKGRALYVACRSYRCFHLFDDGSCSSSVADFIIINVFKQSIGYQCLFRNSFGSRLTPYCAN